MSSETTMTVPVLEDWQRRMFRGSFLLVILAETMIFITLLSTRFLLAGKGHPPELNQKLGIIISLLLVASLLPLGAGLARVRHGARGAAMLGLTALAGAVAVALIVYDWVTLTIDATSRYGENYVMSTGYHALHIVLGLIALAIIAAADRRGEYRAENHWQVEAAATFWLFVVISWAALYAVFFVL